MTTETEIFESHLRVLTAFQDRKIKQLLAAANLVTVPLFKINTMEEQQIKLSILWKELRDIDVRRAFVKHKLFELKKQSSPFI